VRSGDPETITAAVVGLPRSAGVATGTVTFSIVGGSAHCSSGDTVALVSGAATCDTSAAGSSGSTEVVTATYNGDDTFDASTSPARTITVR
jgi:hypothetical protein